MTSAALLTCRDLTCRFGGLVALDHVDFLVHEAEIVGLIGPNGSGKTTLFNVVTGIYALSGGSVDFSGRDLTAASPQDVYWSGIARTFQRSRMCLPLSVFDNIMMRQPQAAEPRARVQSAAAACLRRGSEKELGGGARDTYNF